MRTVGIRDLKQNASAVVAAVTAGEDILITDRGRPVAQLGPLADNRLDRLVVTGRARPPKKRIADLDPLSGSVGTTLSDALAADRAAARY